MKRITDISWNVSETEYRNHKAFSYSILSKFDREGFRKISSLFDEVKSQSLTFGSAVDIALTGGLDEFMSKFTAYASPPISGALENITRRLYDKYGNEYKSLGDIPNEYILEEAIDYQPRYKDSTKLSTIIANGDIYYNNLVLAEGKTVLTMDDYDRVHKCVKELKTNPFTRWYFDDLNPDRYETAYQLKFKTAYMDGEIKCMIDRIIVDHENKKIHLIDLKTTSGNEEDFEESFLKWRYNIQAQLYTFIVDRIINEDEYFSNFTINPFVFIVINKYNLSPIIWMYKNNYSIENITKDGKTYLNWRKVLTRLTYHLNDPSNRYPVGVKSRGGILDINV